LVEPILVLRSKFVDVHQEDIPGYFWPVTGKWRIRGSSCCPHPYIPSKPRLCAADLHKVYVDDEHYNAGHGHAYERYDVGPEVGAVVIVRPDQRKCQYPWCISGKGFADEFPDVSKITTLEDFDGVLRFFEGCLKQQGDGEHVAKL
jgi:phenol 2-monooxygenase